MVGWKGGGNADDGGAAGLTFWPRRDAIQLDSKRHLLEPNKLLPFYIRIYSIYMYIYRTNRAVRYLRRGGCYASRERICFILYSHML